MLDLLATGELEPDSEDTLLQAFKVLDPNGLGYIDGQRMRDLLITKGAAFREKELDQFMQVAKDLETGNVYYEDYIALLSTD